MISDYCRDLVFQLVPKATLDYEEVSYYEFFIPKSSIDYIMVSNDSVWLCCDPTKRQEFSITNLYYKDPDFLDKFTFILKNIESTMIHHLINDLI